MKKFAMMLIALVLCLGMTTSALAWNLEGTVFPLEQPANFTILTSGYRFVDIDKITSAKDWQALCAATNVNINFVFLGDYDAAETRNNLQMRLMGGDYGDAIMSVYVDTLSTADISDLGAAGMIVPLENYMTDPAVMPNFYKNVSSKLNYVMHNMKSGDGHTYAFFPVDETAGYTAGEALLQVNKAWLESWMTARGVDHSPATLAEFEDMLCYFRDSDLNGNGEKDEIPYMMAQGTYMGCATVEHAMGMYGIATKDSTADMNIMIDDDKCYFVHTTEAYKQALKTFSGWYADKLIWDEVFTANAETINNKFALATTAFGVVNVNVEIDGFITIAPPAIEGYQPRYHMHPATRSGIGQPYAVITDKCAQPEVLASFLDLLYDYENHLEWRYGSSAFTNGQLTLGEDGKYIFNVPAMPPAAGEVDDADRAMYDYIHGVGASTLDVFSEKVDMDSYYGGQSRVDGHILFHENGWWNPTEKIWPRCTILPEYAEDYSFMLTDVSSVLAEYRAKFVTGQLSVDDNWDEFQKKLEKLGINDMLEIVQKSYDAYLN